MNISLNDAAAMLMQLEPDDMPEIIRYSEMLNTLSRDMSYPESCRNNISKASEIIIDIIKGRAVSPEESIAETGKYIQEAIFLMEGYHSETGEDSSEDIDPELLAAFITESFELMVKAEEGLLTLENDPENTEAVGVVFRAIHTVKGTSAFFDLALLTEMAHRAESFLSRIRDKEIRYGGGYADLALRSLDMIKALLSEVSDVPQGKALVKPDGYDTLMTDLSNPEKFATAVKPLATSPQTSQPPESEPKHEEEADEPEDAGSPVRVNQQPASHPENQTKQNAESSVRVSIERLDRFVDMVGELVVAHSMVLQDEILTGGIHHELNKKVAHTGKIVRELQIMSMSMRMIPLKSAFRKMARLVRDLARKTGKKINFATEGEDTEIDRNMVDFINDPLVHMVRNAIDHGVESPEERKAAGKPVFGNIQLSAYHSAGNVVVEIRDDGKGFDREVILEKAVERGLISDDPESLAKITEREVYNMIFEPGFSTAKIVSDISGRGVGMDVVRKNVEALRGQVEIQSQPGQGSMFRMNLPLTLAIIDGMVVRAGHENYVVPTLSIVRSVQPEASDISKVLNHSEMIMIQGKLIPMFRLGVLFDVQGTESDPTKGIVMVLEDDGRQVGLLID